VKFVHAAIVQVCTFIVIATSQRT